MFSWPGRFRITTDLFAGKPLVNAAEHQTAQQARIGLWMAVAILLLARWPWFLIQSHAPDECYAWNIGQKLALGARPYEAGWDHKGYLIYYFFALPRAVLGTSSLFAVRAMGTLWIILTALTLHAIARRTACSMAAGIAVLAFSFHSSMLGPVECLGVMSEHLMNLPVAAAIYLFMSRQQPSSRVGLVACGLLIWMAAMFRQVALGLVPALISVLALEAVCAKANGRTREPARSPEGATVARERGLGPEAPTGIPGAAASRRRVLVEGACFVGGLAIGLSLTIGWATAQGVFREWLFWTWKAPFGFASLSTHAQASGAQWWELARRLFEIGDLLPALLLAAWTCTAASLRSLRGDEPLPRETSTRIVLVAWALVMLLSVFPGARFHGHYFLQPIAPLSLLTGMALARLWQDRGAYLERPRVRRAILLGTLPGILVAARWLVHTVRVSSIVPLQTRAVRILMHGPRPEGGVERLAAHLLGRVTSGETILVWGYRPEINTLTNCLTPTRVPTPYGASRSNPMASPAGSDWDRTLETDLARSKPAYIIDASGVNPGSADPPVTSVPALARLLEREYSREGWLEGYVLYARAGRGHAPAVNAGGRL